MRSLRSTEKMMSRFAHWSDTLIVKLNGRKCLHGFGLVAQGDGGDGGTGSRHSEIPPVEDCAVCV
jgi:hypothetical protein